jgi:hypothetical protein
VEKPIAAATKNISAPRVVKAMNISGICLVLNYFAAGKGCQEAGRREGGDCAPVANVDA